MYTLRVKGEQVSTPVWYELMRRKPTARTILEWAGVYTPPVDVVAIANMMGVSTVLNHRLPRDISGNIRFYDNPLSAKISIKPNDPLVRQRFTVAHELGHLFLHHDPKGHEDRSFSGTPKEREANAFAANLLVPMWMLDPLIMQYGTDAKAVEKLADIFKVSKDTMRFRMEKWGGSLREWNGNY